MRGGASVRGGEEGETESAEREWKRVKEQWRDKKGKCARVEIKQKERRTTEELRSDTFRRTTYSKGP